MCPESLARNGHDGENKDEQTDGFDMSRQPVNGGVAVPVERVGVGGAAQSRAALLLRNRTNTPTMTAPMPNVTTTPTRPAIRVPVASSSAPLNA